MSEAFLAVTVVLLFTIRAIKLSVEMLAFHFFFTPMMKLGGILEPQCLHVCVFGLFQKHIL